MVAASGAPGLRCPRAHQGSFARARRMVHDPLRSCSRSTRATGRSSACGCCTARIVFMLGPEANHYVTVSHAAELPLARGQLRRPDPAARRRPADDRRRLPRPRAADHDARLPPRADRGVGRGRWSTEAERGARRLAARRDRRRLRLGAQPGDADRDAGAARPRPRRRRARRRGRRALRAGARASTGPTTTCACCAGRARRGGGWCARAPVLDEIVYGEITERRRRPDPGRLDILEPADRGPRRGRHRASPTARSATR